MGGIAPESLHDFAIEREFWQQLGLTAEAVDRLPWRKAWEYQVYLEIMMRDRAAKRQS